MQKLLRWYNIIDKLLYSILNKYFEDGKRQRVIGEYYPSELSGCLRKLYFIYKLGDRYDEKSVMILSISRIIHDFISDLLCRYNNINGIHIISYSEGSVDYNINDITIKGRYDDIIHIKLTNDIEDTYVVEIKTTSNIDNISEPMSEHILQLNFYLGVLNINRGYIIYVDRRNFNIKAFEVKYSEEMFNEIINRALLLHQCIKNDILPSNINFKYCSRCPFIKECIEYTSYKSS
ncbi:MAG: Dna2/Cas4 domain-containing protein [Candidatus Aenigmatarchaeota archaeon]